MSEHSAGTPQTLGLDLPVSPIIEAWAATVDKDSQLTILDAGCGAGRNALYLAGLGHRVTGINIDVGELENANSALSRRAPLGSCCFMEGDVRQLSFQQPFDAVIVNEV